MSWSVLMRCFTCDRVFLCKQWTQLADFTGVRMLRSLSVSVAGQYCHYDIPRDFTANVLGDASLQYRDSCSVIRTLYCIEGMHLSIHRICIEGMHLSIHRVCTGGHLSIHKSFVLKGCIST